MHGPGCPVCVTPIALIDKAIALAGLPEVILTSFGDMLRVPGSASDLLAAKAAGGDVRMVYSPLDAVTLAEANPDRQVVFFAVGFETTAPANAMAVWRAAKLELQNFSILCSHVLVPPAMEALLGSPDNLVQGFLAAGPRLHGDGLLGVRAHRRALQIPIVVTGFEPLDLLQGILHDSEGARGGALGSREPVQPLGRPGGQPRSAGLLPSLRVRDQNWRGIGAIPASGYRLRDELAQFDAERRFDIEAVTAEESPECIAGLILQGLRKPHECTAFGSRCTPEHPLGAPMVSTEGACAAYHQYGRHA